MGYYYDQYLLRHPKALNLAGMTDNNAAETEITWNLLIISIICNAFTIVAMGILIYDLTRAIRHAATKN